HGVRVVDPYRWLEDESSPEVQSWTRAQDARTRRILKAPPERGAIARRLETLLSIGVLGSPLPRRGRLFFERRDGLEEQPLLYVREGLFGEDRVLVDPLATSPDGTTALDWYAPSPDGRLLAYGLSEGGTEQSTLRVREVASGRDLEGVIPFTRACSLAWRPDGSGFLYTRYPEPGSVPAGEENYHRHVFDHDLGADWKRDAEVFGAGRPPEDWPSVQLSPNGRWLLISVSRGWTRTDVYLADLWHGAALETIIEGEEVVVDPIVLDERLYLRTNHGAPRYRVVEVDPLHTHPEAWREVISEGEDVLEQLAVVGETLLVHSLHQASSRVSLHDRNGHLRRHVDLPAIGTVSGITGEWDGEEAFLGFSSFAIPPTVVRLSLPQGSSEVWQRVEADVDPGAYAVRFTKAPSRDGTPVSLFLVHRTDR
ncbi:MAG TPA: S9 family peptidase, partial [Vicinamibacteria bacterium]|nr:S9 family peptidase [Vicinamibacteria bacterium]